MRARRLALAAGSLLLGAACSAFGEADGSPPTPDAGSVDAATVESGPPLDAGEDGDALPQLPSYCATITPAPVLCDAFEDADLQGPWTSVVQQGASLASAKGALVARAAKGCPRDASAALVHEMEVFPGGVQVAFTVTVPNQAVGSPELLSLEYAAAPATRNGITVTIAANGGLSVHRSAGMSAGSELTFGVEHTVELTMDFREQQLILRVDGMPYHDLDITGPEPKRGLLRLELGLTLPSGCTTDMEATLDDVVYRVTPP